MITNTGTHDLSVAAAPVHPQSVSPGTADTGGLDMTKFNRAIAFLDVGAFGASATVDAKFQESTDNSSFTDVAGSGVAITQLLAAGGNNRVVTMEVHVSQLTKRYLRIRVTVGTAATTLSCVIIGFNETGLFPANKHDIAAVAQRLLCAN